MPTLPNVTKRTSAPKQPQPQPTARLPWYSHLISLAVLLLVYLAGYTGGRDASLSNAANAHQNHPACHPNLKP